MISNFLYLSFSTLYSSSLWRTDTVVFAKWNKLPLLNKPPPPRLYWHPLKPWGILEDSRYSSWQRSLHKQGYSLISIRRDAWWRNNGQRSFADTRVRHKTHKCSKPVENRLKPDFFFNLFDQVSGRIWTVVGSGYFSYATSYGENLASARSVSGMWQVPPKLQMNKINGH